MLPSIKDMHSDFENKDNAWQAELVRLFGRDACNVRYEKRGRGSFTNEDGRQELGRLYLAREKARQMLAGKTGVHLD